MSSSLSSVVSSLVNTSRTTTPNNVLDEELDRHVAELILKEAKQKADSYIQHGVRAYLPEPESNVPRPNKRFLSNIIRSTDDHNKAVLRAQAEAAYEAKAERDHQERQHRRARASEAADAEKLRRLAGGSRRSDDKWRHDKHDRRDRSRDRSRNDDRRDRDRSRAERKRRRSPSEEHGEDRRSKRHGRSDQHGDSRRRRKSRSTSRTPEAKEDRKRSEHKSSRHDRDRHSDRRDERRRHHSLKESSSSTPRSNTLTPPPFPKDSPPPLPPVNTNEPGPSRPRRPSPSPGPSKSSTPKYDIDLSEQFRSRREREEVEARASPTLSEEEDIERLNSRKSRLRRKETSRAPTVDVEDPSLAPPSSKMDKYFEESYDPRLDVAPLALPQVPSTGLVDGAEFEGWEAMLDIIKQRREDKAERKRLIKAGLLPDPDKEKEVKKKKSDAAPKFPENERWNMAVGGGLMDIQYTKKGAVREWDMGKEGF